jgi:hypothetical protein
VANDRLPYEEGQYFGLNPHKVSRENSNFPEKIVNVHGFDDLIFTDHKLISFDIDMCIPKKIETKRVVYKFKNADWKGLTEALRIVPWDLCFEFDDVNQTASNWCDVFISTVDDYIDSR